MARVFASTILFLSVVLFPWWIPAAAGIIFAFMFRSFYELAAAALILVLLYGADGDAVFSASRYLVVGSFSAVFMIGKIKKMTRY